MRAAPNLAAVILAAAGAACSVSSPVSRELGARCDDQAECDERCLEGPRYPGGFCSVSCDDDGDCPDDASCVDLEGGVCLSGCVDTAGCEFLGDGWECRTAPQRGGGPSDEVMVCVGPL